MSKKEKIFLAAIELFAERGIEHTSVQQITDHCGISKGAFYLHFKSKEQLILEILDYFMQNAIIEIDRAVRNAPSNNEKLYQYFYCSLQMFEKNKTLALIFFKETMIDIGEHFLHKMHFYEGMTMMSLSNLLDSIYGDKVKHSKYDLILFMQGMIKTYINAMIFLTKPIETSTIASSLVEKTKVFAQHCSINVISFEHLFEDEQILFSPSIIVSTLNDSIGEANTHLEKQSIELLIEQFQSDNKQHAIIQGLMHNIESNEKLAWICFILRLYLTFNNK